MLYYVILCYAMFLITNFMQLAKHNGYIRFKENCVWKPHNFYGP